MNTFPKCNWTFSFVLLFLAAFSMSVATKAQTTLGISAEIGAPSFNYQAQIPLVAGIADIPVDLSQNTNSGFGFSAKLQRRINDKVAIYGKAGLLVFENNNFGDIGDVGTVLGGLTNLQATVTAIPLQLGAKIYFAEGLYASGEVGAHHITNKLSAKLLVDVSAKETFTEMSFAPGIGYEVDLGDVSLDIGARYQMVKGGLNYLGVNAGINIPLGYTVYR